MKTVEMYPKTPKPKWLRVGAKVECLGEGRGCIFTVADVRSETCSSMLLDEKGQVHGRESWSKLYLPG